MTQTQTIRAVFRNGAFVPLANCDLPENSEVELRVGGPVVLPPSVKDPQERAEILQRVVERMRQNPLPQSAPRYTRDELHERG